MHRGTFQADDVELREKGVVRIYDIFFDYTVLLDTDAFFREIIAGPSSSAPMSTAEFHYLCGKYVRAREEKLGLAAPLAARRGLRVRRADLHLVAGRLVDRHERRGEGARGQQAAARRERRRQRDRGDRLGREGAAAARAPCGSSAAAVPRTSCSRPSRRSRKCSASRRRATTTSWRHRRAPRHRRPLRRDAGRGGELGQDRSRSAARAR